MRRAYRGRTFNRESVYVCGDYMDGSIYPVYQQAGKRRKKCRPTSAIQQRLNQRNAERKLARIVHNNFTGDDMALHLTYRPGEEPETEEAKRILANYIRRLKRLYRKLGLELRYISCTEYGRTNGRVHHHLIISGGADRDTIEQLWGRGYANSKRLQFTLMRELPSVSEAEGEIPPPPAHGKVDIHPLVDVVFVRRRLHKLKIRIALLKPLPLCAALNGLRQIGNVLHVQPPVVLGALGHGEIPEREP